MLLQEQREQIAHYAQELVRRGLSTGLYGNLSCFVPETKVLVISPRDKDLAHIQPGDVSVVTMDGVQLDGKSKPSQESELHRAFYRARPDIGAVVHTHSPYATVMACVGQPLEPVHYLMACAGGEVPCIPYYPIGSQELSDAAAAGIGKANALLLGNHGLCCVGKTLTEAVEIAQQLEFASQLCYQTRLVGGGVRLTPEQLEATAKALAEAQCNPKKG